MDDAMSISKSLNPPSKDVTFAPMAQVKVVMPIDDYSEEEVKRCWYSSDEMYDIKNQIRHTVESRKTLSPSDDECFLLESTAPGVYEKFDMRGLETYFPAANKRRQGKRRSIHLVIQEQYFAPFQEDEVDYDASVSRRAAVDLEVAQAYKKAAYDCKMAAYLRGVSDAKVAKRALEDHGKELATKRRPERTKQISNKDISLLPPAGLKQSQGRHDFFSLAAQE